MIKSIKFKFLFILTLLFVGCSLLKKEPKINTSINHKDLFFIFEDRDTLLLGYEINSLENFNEDGLTYKNIIKYQDYEGFKDVVIRDYRKKNILDNHAYYLMVTKEGAKFQTLGFCIKNKLIQIQKNKNDDQGFVERCNK